MTAVIDTITNQIERYMDLLSARQKLVVSNIANIDTPGYKAKDIDFQFEFQSLPRIRPRVRPPMSWTLRAWWSKATATTSAWIVKRGCSSENALRFNVASSLMKAQLKMVESAIKEGQSG